MSPFPRSAPSSPDVSPQSSPRPPRANNDRLTLLTRLVRKGEKKGLFVEKMPASIYQVKLYQLRTVTQRWGTAFSFRFFSFLFVFCADGERWESEVHEEQRRVQQRLLQLHPLPGVCQCSMSAFFCPNAFKAILIFLNKNILVVCCRIKFNKNFWFLMK